MLKMKKISEMYSMRVFTDTGEYFGDIEDVMLTLNKVHGWKVKSTKGSFLSKVLGSAKGVVKAVSDVMIISKGAIPASNSAEDATVAQ